MFIVGSHTIGQARCTVFRTRIYSDNNVNSSFASLLRSKCSMFGKDNDLSPLDMSTPTVFDNGYYKNLLNKRGLLHSDQQLYLNESGLVSSRVSLYAKNSTKFFRDFASAMVKMGNIGPLIGENGEIRTNCRKINWLHSIWRNKIGIRIVIVCTKTLKRSCVFGCIKYCICWTKSSLSNIWDTQFSRRLKAPCSNRIVSKFLRSFIGYLLM